MLITDSRKEKRELDEKIMGNSQNHQPLWEPGWDKEPGKTGQRGDVAKVMSHDVRGILLTLRKLQLSSIVAALKLESKLWACMDAIDQGPSSWRWEKCTSGPP